MWEEEEEEEEEKEYVSERMRRRGEEGDGVREGSREENGEK